MLFRAGKVGREITFLIYFIFFMAMFLSFAEAREIHGKISVEPPFPAQRKITVRKKTQDSCASERLSQSLIVSKEGFLKNAVVYLKGDFPEKFAAGLRPPVMDQKDCNFEPHVQIVPQKGLFKVENSDPLAHDVRIFQDARMLSRFEMDAGQEPVEQRLEEPRVYLLRCGLHPWMHAFVVSAAHAFYAISDENGEVVLKNVPPGKQTLRIWHETLGETEIPLETAESVQNFSYTFKQPQTAKP